MIPWDFDMDVAGVVEGPREMSEAILPTLVEFIMAQGHRTLVMPNGFEGCSSQVCRV
jgi:hypothetical protein